MMDINLEKIHEYAIKKPTGRCMGKSFYAQIQIASLLLTDSSKNIFTVLSYYQDILLTVQGVSKILENWGVDYKTYSNNPRIEANGKIVRFITEKDYRIKTMGFKDFNIVEDKR